MESEVPVFFPEAYQKKLQSFRICPECKVRKCAGVRCHECHYRSFAQGSVKKNKTPDKNDDVREAVPEEKKCWGDQ
jgi:hypothetical protein